ncbi:MAG: YkvA family protein [Chitinophagaceae bacterium]
MNLIVRLKEKVRELKAEIQVLIIAYSDRRTPMIAKLVIGVTVGYLLSPIDLIPDFIPVLGLLDDLIIVPLLITLSIKLIPKVIITDARQKVKENPEKLKKNNWLFAVIIIFIWLTLLYFIYRQFGNVFTNYFHF